MAAFAESLVKRRYLEITKSISKLLPLQRCVLHVLVCLDGPRPLQSLPPFAGRGLLHKRERSCVPLPHFRLQGPQSLHSEYPPCTVTPDSSQFYQTK